MGDIEVLQEQLDLLAAVRARFNRQKAELDETGLELAGVRQAVLEELQTKGIKTLKNAHLTATVVEKPQLTISNPQAALRWLDEQGLEADSYIKLDSDRFKPIGLASIKASGEIPSGCAFTVTEYLNLKENKSGS